MVLILSSEGRMMIFNRWRCKRRVGGLRSRPVRRLAPPPAGTKSLLKQQAGYGEAEALLLFKHPERFNRRGESKWRGVMYGMSLSGIRLGRSLIYTGSFGSGLFQCCTNLRRLIGRWCPRRWNGTPRQMRLALQHWHGLSCERLQPLCSRCR